MVALLFLDFVQIIVETIEALIPELPIVLEPSACLLQRLRLKSAGAPLGLARARDQAGALEHLEMFRDGRQAHRKGRGQLANRALARRELREDRASGRISERREGGIETVG